MKRHVPAGASRSLLTLRVSGKADMKEILEIPQSPACHESSSNSYGSVITHVTCVNQANGRIVAKYVEIK